MVSKIEKQWAETDPRPRGELLAELTSLRADNKALTAEVADITGTLKYCEECWSDERGTMIDKIQFERARAESFSAELAEARKHLELAWGDLQAIDTHIDQRSFSRARGIVSQVAFRIRSFLASKGASQ